MYLLWIILNNFKNKSIIGENTRNVNNDLGIKSNPKQRIIIRVNKPTCYSFWRHLIKLICSFCFINSQAYSETLGLVYWRVHQKITKNASVFLACTDFLVVSSMTGQRAVIIIWWTQSLQFSER